MIRNTPAPLASPTRRSLLAAASLVAGSRLASGAAPVRIVALGDSLTAGYLLPADAAFPAVLEKALAQRGLAVTITNAGVSGDTSAGGLARLDWSVAEGTAGVVVELGANDALRGLDPVRTEANLDAILSRLAKRNIRVLLAGMLAPRNNGPDYVAAFDGLYPRLAAKHGVPLYPFFLDGVTGVAGMTLPDGLHPSREGVAEIVRRILPMAEQFVRDLTAAK
ncbi:MAG TPA: arylesterase [Beijerinckiaceae bacterium]|nr:arylesterase [Beijerinckiaceae bacterium]